METLWQDVRYAARMLGSNRTLTIIAVLTLALGIGANTAIFSLTDQVLLRQLPVERPEELVLLRQPGPMSGAVWSDGDAASSFSYPSYKDLRDTNSAFTGLLARFAIPLNVAHLGSTERAWGELVSGNYFQVLGVAPAAGRMFTPEDDEHMGGHPVVVLSHAYWTRRFGADPGIVNQTLVVNGHSMTVLGVAGAGFRGVQTGKVTDIFLPLTMKPQMTPTWSWMDNRRGYFLALIGRLKPGLTREQAEAQLLPAFRPVLEQELATTTGWPAETREKFLNKRIELVPGARGRLIIQREAEKPLLLLMGMVGLVLLIGCANVANLLVARGAARQREIAIRLALGAERRHLLRLLLVESLLLALAGGAAGLLAGFWAIDGLLATIPAEIGMDGLRADLNLRLLGFNMGLALLTGLLFGLAPALRATRVDLAVTLKEQGASTSQAVPQARFRKGLVVAQVALTSLLLVGAGLFARSLSNLNRLDLGSRTDNLLMFSVAPDLNGYSTARTVAFFDQLRRALAAAPGVTSASVAQFAYFADTNSGSNVTVEGSVLAPDDDSHSNINYVGPGFFTTLGVPLLQGRELTEQDGATAPPVALVNETFVKKFFAGGSPLGRRFVFGAGDVRPEIEIVGVVKDNKHSTVRQQPTPFVYLPYAQRKDLGQCTVYVRTSQDPQALAALIRREVQRLDANLPVFALRTVERQIAYSLYADRLLGFLSAGFAGLAALLASIGIYGVMVYSVARRTREIGIRMALGASAAQVRWMILREVCLMAALGIAVGLPAAYGLGRFVESLLFGVQARDLAVFAVAAALLAAVALAAGYFPARRAVRVAPARALRYE